MGFFHSSYASQQSGRWWPGLILADRVAQFPGNFPACETWGEAGIAQMRDRIAQMEIDRVLFSVILISRGRHASFRGVIPGAADLCNAGILGIVRHCQFVIVAQFIALFSMGEV